ncbi:5'-methylthioadenosine/S-adenosylhomocysteine nucleosidase [soil metagenome]
MSFFIPRGGSAIRHGLLACLLGWLAIAPLEAATPAKAVRCLSECTPRIGIVSAFGAEADILVGQTTAKQTWTINGNRYTTGTLRGNRVVIVLSGVSIVNAAMTTQLMLDHFRITHLLMSGIAGGLDADNHIGDVLVPQRWVQPFEGYWNRDATTPAPCGAATDLSCLGLKIAPQIDGIGTPMPGTGIFMRETYVMTANSPPTGEFKFGFEVDPMMLAVARSLSPPLRRCGPANESLCVPGQPALKVGGVGVSGSFFMANPQVRDYLNKTIGALVVDMETAALAQVAYANGVPYIAFRSLSDLAGGDDTKDVGAFFGSGLAEANEAFVTLSFLEAWAKVKH